MHDPFWVADVQFDVRQPSVVENQYCVLWTEEGRTRPSRRISRASHHFQPWIRPASAKSASSQGGALATSENVSNQLKFTSEDMIMELIHD